MTDPDEERANLYQRISDLEQKIARMSVWRSDDGMNALSLRVAHLIEDYFAQHHEGGRTQRLAKIQVIVREAIRESHLGERHWDAWYPGSTRVPPRSAP